MPNKQVAITGGPNNTKAMVTGQEELLVKINSSSAGAFNASGVAKTPTIARPTASGTITAGVGSASIANVGSANGTVATVTLKPGETVNFDAGPNNTLASIAYDATGTEFLIITIS